MEKEVKITLSSNTTWFQVLLFVAGVPLWVYLLAGCFYNLDPGPFAIATGAFCVVMMLLQLVWLIVFLEKKYG